MKKLITRYTGGLYDTSGTTCHPRYDEFRDMFSDGQLESKEWLVEAMKTIAVKHEKKRIAIVGSWFGTLGVMINEAFPEHEITLIDIDPRCEQFIERIMWDLTKVNAATEDMYKYDFSGYDMVINTACEHIPNIQEWLALLPGDTTVILQSNNMYDVPDHIACVDNLDEFITQTGLVNIELADDLDLSHFTRFMIIATTETS